MAVIIDRVRKARDGTKSVLVECTFMDLPWCIRGVYRWTANAGLQLRELSVAPLPRADFQSEPEADLPPSNLDTWVPANGVTATLLQGLGLPAMRDATWRALREREDLRRWEAVVDTDTDAAEEATTIAAVLDGDANKAAGRPKISEARIREFAEQCVAIQEAGFSRAPIRRLVDLTGKPESTVKKWIARARSLGYLAPTQRGVSQLLPGPRLDRGDNHGEQD